MALARQFRAQFRVILDNPVVNNCQQASAVGMGMRVRVVGASVRRPAGMADAQRTRLRSLGLRHRAFQVRDFAGPAMEGQYAIGGENRDASGVIAPVLKPGQRVEQNGSDIGPLRADVANDTAHGGYPFCIRA